jgi:hypothetical protein
MRSFEKFSRGPALMLWGEIPMRQRILILSFQSCMSGAAVEHFASLPSCARTRALYALGRTPHGIAGLSRLFCDREDCFSLRKIAHKKMS